MPENSFESSRELVLKNAALLETLRQPDVENDFVEQVGRAGVEHGYRFTVADVQEAMSVSHHSWLQRWI